jgi:UDP-N-acetylmuramate--alanine ligase
MSASPVAIEQWTTRSQFAGKRVHFIGIGGSGMSGLARMLLDRGAGISGSDQKPGGPVLQLMERGAQVTKDQDGQLLHGGINLVVRTAAIPDTNAEYQAAVRLGLPVVKYAQLLGWVMRESLGVAIAGTHGKSTTSAMTSYALLQLGADPSFVIGATVPQLGGGSRSGGGEVFVAESCEYDRSFHNLFPRVAVITNIDADHLDVYKDLADIEASFATFARLVPSDGRIVSLGGSPAVARAMAAGVSAPVDLVYLDGQPTSPNPRGDNWTIRPIESTTPYPAAEVRLNGVKLCELRLSIPGQHNLLNATMAIAACKAAGYDPILAAAAIEKFTGVDRRMTRMGEVNGATVVDDYGHHPTEVVATLAALRAAYKPKRLFCVFQPHQASRTRALIQEFSTAFKDADEVLLPEIYYVRDSQEDKQAVSSALLAARVTANGTPAHFVATYEAAVNEIRARAQPGDLVVTMGAGPVCEVAQALVSG